MLTTASSRPVRHVRGIVFLAATLAIATLAIVPALVLATQQASGPSVRLTRGFNAPPAKCHVVPPITGAAAVLRESPPSPHVRPAGFVLAELIPDSLPVLSLDPLRGPPASPLA